MYKADRMRHPSDHPHKAPWFYKLWWASLILILLGVVMCIGNQWHLSRYTWHPVVIPLAIEKGKVYTAAFEAELDQAYDLEIYTRQDVAYGLVRSLMMVMGKPSTLDIRWSVQDPTGIIASGNCRDYMHLIERRGIFPKRVIKAVLNETDHQALIGPPTVARGVGRIKCRKGQRYDVRVDIGSIDSGLAPAQPEFVVTVNRRFMKQYFGATRWLNIGGVMALSVGVLLGGVGVWGGIARYVNRNAKN